MYNADPGRLPTNMMQHFDRIPAAVLQRSQFVSPYTYKTTLNAGYIVPFGAFEVLPGDTFNDQFQVFGRIQSLIRPIMDNVWMDTHYFFVPNRLLWTHWEQFIANQQTNPTDVNSYIMPTSTSPVGGYAIMSLQDYLGLGTVGQIGGGNTFTHTVMHTRAYNFIWNEFYRDQNLQNSVTVDTGDGPDTPANYVLLQRNKRFDYLTSCLPAPQKGTAASLGLSGQLPITGIGIATSSQAFPQAGVAVTETPGGGQTSYAHSTNASTTMYFQGSAATSATPTIYANASGLSFTINAFRLAFQTQMLLEKDARGGTRYVESLWAHFGVISPDFRLQRPEYLGGSTSPLSISPVAQTSPTSGSNPQAQLAAFGVVSNHKSGYMKSFVEHGVILCLCSIRADLTYQQGMHRMWSRSTRYDFYWPAFANLGEQPVYNREIYADGSANDALVFGYQEAWAIYRYQPSMITGQMRSTAATPQDIWHLSQKFASLPTLGSTFITENPPISRIVADTTDPQFYLDVFGTLKRSRVMPIYSVPGLVTRL